MLILKQISGAVCLLNSYSKFTLSQTTRLLTYERNIIYNKIKDKGDISCVSLQEVQKDYN